jgi:hypothetical protein
MIREAWRHTAFARPSFTSQPKGGTTLIRLKTFFQVDWPTKGFQPDEVDQPPLSAMLGHAVRIRPTLIGYTYDFGDGTKVGPTKSPGGSYPDGDVTHAYPKKGTYHPTVTTTYGGEFSVDGGEWIPIPDTLDITGPAGTITVKTSKNRLVAQ